MRIISGIYKGRVIKGFDIDGTRPTMERVKESLFGMIQSNLKDSIILDLFCGSGNLGIEAISWGAKKGYLVDKNIIAYKTALKNVNDLGIKNIDVLNKDYKEALKYFKDNNIKFDLVFLDPPYKDNLINTAIKLICEYELLNYDGLIVCEFENEIVECDYTLYKERKYGSKTIKI